MKAERITTEEQREAAAAFCNGIKAGQRCPEPGIYHDVSMMEYLSWTAFSASIAHELLERSPLHAKWAAEHFDPPKPYTDQGTAMHMAILEPERFVEQYRRCPGPWNANPGKADSTKIKDSGLTPIKPDDDASCAAARENVLTHPKLGKLFADPKALREVSIVFDMETDHGPLRCKIRPDLVSTRYQLCVDIKTTTNATRRPFLKICRSFGYHRKCALYLEGLHAAGIECATVFLAAIEQAMPCGVIPYAFGHETMNQAGLAIEHAANVWARCRAENHYPSYDETILELGAEGDYL